MSIAVLRPPKANGMSVMATSELFTLCSRLVSAFVKRAPKSSGENPMDEITQKD
jgi:hypothetical protein